MAQQEELPLVSVCIPVYNRVDLIEETLTSVLSQDYPNIEIVVQDNASTDGTWEKIEHLASRQPQIKIQRNEENIGPIPNWNRAMNRAQGEYRMWLSSDDLLEAGFISRCVRCCSEFSADAVATNFYILEDGVRQLRRKKLKAGLYEDLPERLLFSPMLFSINFTLFRAAALEQVSRQNNFMAKKLMACDYDLWFRLALSEKKIYYVEEPLGSYRIHASNDSKQKKRLRRHTLMVLLSHRQALQQRYGVKYKLMLLRYALRLLRPSAHDKRLQQAVCGRLRS